MIDGDMIIGGVASQVASSKILHEILPNHLEHQTAHLQNIDTLLQEIKQYIEASILPKESEDSYFNQTLYKSGFGPPWIPNLNGREYLRVLVAANTPIFVTTSIGSFTFTIPAPGASGNFNVWFPLELPDQTVIQLDVSATLSQQTMYVKRTLVK